MEKTRDHMYSELIDVRFALEKYIYRLRGLTPGISSDGQLEISLKELDTYELPREELTPQGVYPETEVSDDEDENLDRYWDWYWGKDDSEDIDFTRFRSL